MKKCYRINITGIVQGVGFRPFVYSIASQLAVCGFVVNDTAGVVIEAEGDADDLHTFVEKLTRDHPHLARIETIEVEESVTKGYSSFSIQASSETGERAAFFSPDIALCDACRSEMLTKDDRRCYYPFITCTNCGPRFSIVTDIPYDRCNTSMSAFELCDECREEYSNPVDRRFHAQPVACPVCGPHMQLYDNNSKPIETSPFSLPARVAELLRNGAVIAIKGLGGYHIAVDAKNESAVAELRKRKNRPFKPFAVMARDIESFKRFAAIGKLEQDLLQSWITPIVLVEQTEPCISGQVAPGLHHIGIMLPYTPFQHLLFEQDSNLVLVMTSANDSNEPVFFRDNDAFSGLQNIADYIVAYNREITGFSDDSVMFTVANRPFVIRRSRGYVPAPVIVPDNRKHIFAMGGDLKNSFALSRKKHVILSQYFGDMISPKIDLEYRLAVDHFLQVYNFHPEIIVLDKHPGYRTTQLAEQFAEKWQAELVSVQHHHAHIASVLADNNFEHKCLGLAFDGTGYGSDGTLWGSEILLADQHEYTRLGHFSYFGLPGGEQAITDVWKTGVSLLYESYGSNFDFFENQPHKHIILEMLKKKINTPQTCSIGRLFDGVSAILGIREQISCEAEAAILLEETARQYTKEIDPCIVPFTDNVFDTSMIVRYVVDLLRQGEEPGTIAYAFHQSIIASTVNYIDELVKITGVHNVALSGGVFQNRILLEGFIRSLEQAGLNILLPVSVPFNDQCLALGQAAIARKRIRQGI